MIRAIKAEFRKLLSVRSTYVISLIVLALVIFIAGYIEGWHLSAADLRQPTQFSSDALGALGLSIFGAIVAILLMTHEYRYNTITYTLTTSNSRSKVLLAKIVAISTYAIILTAIVAVLSPVASDIGAHLHGHAFAPQTLDFWNLAKRSLFYGWAYGMIGLLLATLIRSQVGAIVSLFVVPSVVERLIGNLLLKQHAVYLPFSALDQVISTPTAQAPPTGQLEPGKAALVVMIYLVVGWAIAWVLFLKRDAN